MAKKQTDSTLDELKKDQSKIKREFKYLEASNNIQYAFALAQATEICEYLKRLLIAPFQAWESFIYKSINRNKEDFFYKFYVCENEFGVMIPDLDRINKLKV